VDQPRSRKVCSYFVVVLCCVALGGKKGGGGLRKNIAWDVSLALPSNGRPSTICCVQGQGNRPFLFSNLVDPGRRRTLSRETAKRKPRKRRRINHPSEDERAIVKKKKNGVREGGARWSTCPLLEVIFPEALVRWPQVWRFKRY
jgi:hypothetical protein